MTEKYDYSYTEGKHKPKPVESCDIVAVQKADICISAKVKPFAEVGDVDVKCCDKPVITKTSIPCKGVKNGECDFVITQKITVEIPIEYGADVIISDPYVACDSPYGDDCDCGK